MMASSPYANRSCFAAERRGFSLIELMIVVSITAAFIGLAAVGYVQYSKRVVVETAASGVEAVLRGARQAAVATRTARRVVIDLEKEQLFVQRKYSEIDPFDKVISLVAGDPSSRSTVNAQTIGQVTKFPPEADIIDVSGCATADIPDPLKYYYIEFDTQGRNARGYRRVPGRIPSDDLDEGMHIHVGRRTGRVVLPDMIDYNRFQQEQRRDVMKAVQRTQGRLIVPEVARRPQDYLPSGTFSAQPPLWQRQFGESARTSWGTSELNGPEMVGVLSLNQLREKNRAGYNYPVDILRVEVAQHARAQVHTIVVLPLTGRVHAFPYGIGFPWSDRELIEVLGVSL